LGERLDKRTPHVASPDSVARVSCGHRGRRVLFRQNSSDYLFFEIEFATTQDFLETRAKFHRRLQSVVALPCYDDTVP